MTNATFINTGYINAHNTEVDIVFTNTGTNNGVMAASGTGTLDISYSVLGVLQSGTFTNNGLIQINSGATSTITDGVYQSFYGTMTNNGLIDVNGGHLTLNTPWAQAGHGDTMIRNNGTLTLESATNGGTIQIQSGMLDFEGFTGFILAPYSVLSFNADVAFTGATGTLHVPDQLLSIAFKDATQELLIYGESSRTPGSTPQIGDIHLTGGHYSLANFTVDPTALTISFHR